MIRRYKYLLMTLLAFLAFPAALPAKSITYAIVNYPEFQNGWTLSGSITTDGKTGAILSSDITAWSWTISMGTMSFTYANTSPGASVSPFGGVMASASEIYLPKPASTGGVNELGLGVTVPDASSLLMWKQQITNGGDDIGVYSAYVQNSAPNAWSTNPNTTTGLGGENWIVAVVPEPSSLFLAGTGITCMILVARIRDGKARDGTTRDL